MLRLVDPEEIELDVLTELRELATLLMVVSMVAAMVWVEGAAGGGGGGTYD